MREGGRGGRGERKRERNRGDNLEGWKERERERIFYRNRFLRGRRGSRYTVGGSSRAKTKLTRTLCAEITEENPAMTPIQLDFIIVYLCSRAGRTSRHRFRGGETHKSRMYKAQSPRNV